MQHVGPCCPASVPAQGPTGQTSPAEFLSTVSPHDKPWDLHRFQVEQVAAIFEDGLPHHQRQAVRMGSCSKILEFGWLLDRITGELEFRLKGAKFCRVRFCPTCQWRRALMWVARFNQAFPRIYLDHPEMRYLLLTLTVRNCRVLDLRDTVKAMNYAWDKLTRRKVWPALGFVRSLEITRGKDGSAHPHFHVVLAVPPGYFVGRKYLSTAKWAALWQAVLGVDYTPIVDVRIVKPKKREDLRRTSPLGSDAVMMDETRAAITSPESHNEDGGRSAYDPWHEAIQPKPWEVLLAGITEVIKYAVKPADMVADPDWLLELADQLRKSRAVAVGGIFRKYLAEDEPEDLITENEDEKRENPGGLHFGWREDPRIAKYARKHSAA